MPTRDDVPTSDVKRNNEEIPVSAANATEEVVHVEQAVWNEGTINVTSPRRELAIDDYLKASSDATARTRSILIVMIVASVLALAGLFNSLQSQWMHNRMIRLGDAKDPYLVSKLGLPPDTRKMDAKTAERAAALYEKREEALCAAIETAYVENALIVRVPFFGITFDVNDLGLMAGIGFLLILTCYRFFLTRENDNLRLSFTEASDCGMTRLSNFYSLLAMRQVFTVPQSPFIKRSRFLLYLPKLLTWIPGVLLLAILVHDLITAWIGRDLSVNRFNYEVGAQAILICLVAWVSGSITKRLFVMDEIWNTVSFMLIHAFSGERQNAILRWTDTFRGHKPFQAGSRPGLLPNEEA